MRESLSTQLYQALVLIMETWKVPTLRKAKHWTNITHIMYIWIESVIRNVPNS